MSKSLYTLLSPSLGTSPLADITACKLIVYPARSLSIVINLNAHFIKSCSHFGWLWPKTYIFTSPVYSTCSQTAFGLSRWCFAYFCNDCCMHNTAVSAKPSCTSLHSLGEIALFFCSYLRVLLLIQILLWLPQIPITALSKWHISALISVYSLRQLCRHQLDPTTDVQSVA